MDPEVKDESNNCETEENSKDSSAQNNSSVLKDGAKKVLNSVNEDDCIMSVDKEDEQISSDKCPETKNGVIDKNADNEKEHNAVQDNNENHESNDVGEKDTSSEAITNKDSDSAKECEQNESKKSEEKEQSDNKNNEAVSNASEPSDKKSEGESNCQSVTDEKAMDIDAPADTNSSEKDSVKDSIRPADADSIASSVDAPVENSSKTDSSNKETKDDSKTEDVNDESSAKEKKEKGKETEESAPSEGKTEHSKKDGETKKKKGKTCEECGVKKKLKFQVLFKGKTRFLCSDTCFKEFKSKQSQPKPPEETPAAPPPSVPEKSDKCGQCQKDLTSDQSYYPVVGEVKTLCSEECIKKYHAENLPAKSCSQCKKVIENPQNPDILTWETMVFCNDDCLGKYQSYLGSHCTCCQSPVPQTSLGKYCVCFGADIRQFCSCSCLDDFKKNLKVCSFCQTDLSSGVDSFLAPVGDKGQFKDFCSQNCMERYEVMNNISKNTPQTQVCSHCKKQGSFKIQVKQNNQTYALCGDLCVAGFRSTHKIKEKMCHTCFNFFNMFHDKDKEFSFKFDGQLKQFCTKACMTLFVLSHRKIVACVSCKVKKYNFDMIEKSDGNNQVQVFCSLNCLSLYRVSVNATSAKSVRCDNCTKNLPAQYHLTMSDGSIRNFCTYNCVMLFQNQYTNVCTLTTTSATRQTASSVPTTTSKVSPAPAPVISNVVSLAPPVPRTPGQTIIRNIVPPKLVTTRPPLQPLAIIGSKIYSLAPATRVVTPVITQNVPSKLEADQPLSTVMASDGSKPAAAATVTSSTTITNVAGQQVLREVIVKPPAPKSQKNKSVACKPIMQNKGINVKPQPCHKAVQTDDSPRPILLPVPVPYYVPVPIHMFSRPVPCPVPFPVPMFVPIVVPSKDSSSLERISSGEKSLEKKSDENNIRDSLKDGNNTQKENIEKSNQENLHSSYLTRTDDQAGPSGSSDDCNDANECEDDEYVFKDGKSHHHGKRHAQHKNKGHKKSKMDDTAVDDARSHNIVSVDENRNSSVQNDLLEPVPRLKHMFGVNAWKQWVLQKNEQMERGSHSSRKFKLFKTDLLQLPPDELNYSLSLFVKEVRKPNGEEYGSGSIYYLCLGIQKYLFQNGRIDNIFSDPYYEKFCECLHEILLGQDKLYSLEGIEKPPKGQNFEKCVVCGTVQFKGFPASRIEEEVLWESKQLGAHSPYALLNTVMYFNAKYFKLKKTEDHSQLSFNHMLTIFDRKSSDRPDKIGVLRYYPNGKKCEDSDCNHNTSDCIDGPSQDPSDNSYKEIENSTDSMRCPVRLFEFYLSKCPDSCRGRNDMFYLHPERSCVPDSAVWYSVQPLGRDIISKMVQRIKLIKDIYDN